MMFPKTFHSPTKSSDLAWTKARVIFHCSKTLSVLLSTLECFAISICDVGVFFSSGNGHSIMFISSLELFYLSSLAKFLLHVSNP